MYQNLPSDNSFKTSALLARMWYCWNKSFWAPFSWQDLHLYLKKAKNAQHREQLRKANTDGIQLDGETGPKTLPVEVIEEALIISDLFNLNEYSSVELLLAGKGNNNWRGVVWKVTLGTNIS